MLSLLEMQLAQRNFSAAVRYFETYRTYPDGVGGSAGGSIYRLAAKAYASLAEFAPALKAARTAQAMVSSDHDTGLLAEVFITLGGILRDMNELREAEKAYRDAESIFRRTDGLEGQSRALNHLAGLFFRQNDYRNALSVLIDAAEIARQLDDKQKLAFMMGNIGRIYTFLGDLSAAEQHLRLNIDLSDELGDTLEKSKALLSLAYLQLQTAEYVEAESSLEAAYLGIVETQSQRDEVIYLTYLGELLYRTGRTDRSRTVLERGLALAEEFGAETSLAGRVRRHLAELFVILGNNRLARKHCSSARVIFRRVGDKVELGALSKIDGLIASAGNRAAEARRAFIKAIDLLDESGVRWEKAEALVAAGKSGVFTQRQRMTYLFRAEEFYGRSRIAARHEEVSSLVSNLETKTSEVLSESKSIIGSNKLDYLTNCREIRKLKKQLPLLKNADLTLLLTGETGVGKDHMARYYHSLVRPNGPYVAINCASVPETLLESELFGYARGAFTGAAQNKEGLFVLAHGGVLLLDEIGDMPLSIQAKLLGVIEKRKVLPLGSTEEIDLDIKLVAATNTELETMVEEGTFRRDLYFRLSGFGFHMPPLRERKEDIPLLLNHFMSQRNLLADGQEIPVELVRRFIEYDWPGNIRELDNKIKRMELFAQMVVEGDLSEVANMLFDDENTSESISLFDRVEQFERELIRDAILAARGNKSEAARMLGVHEATVRTKLKRYGIDLNASS
jgi:DNA-binding NtrC family response regulator